MQNVLPPYLWQRQFSRLGIFLHVKHISLTISFEQNILMSKMLIDIFFGILDHLRDKNLHSK